MRKASSVMKKTFSPSNTVPVVTKPSTSTSLYTLQPTSNSLSGPSVSSLNEEAIAPSISTFTLNKEDRPEKLKKKAKHFLMKNKKRKHNYRVYGVL
ncbi:unnamed protein product [Cunninghamella blakesleeana]